MRNKFLLLAVASTLACAGTAIAGQPVRLTDTQMDRVTAGAVASAIGSAEALGNLAAQTLTFSLSTASVNGTALAMGLSTASASSLLLPAVAASKSSAIARTP